MKSKRKILLISVISISFILCVLVVFVIYNIFNKNDKVIIDGEYINNVYNNWVFDDGNLLRIDDKLYYNYNETNAIFKYGLYEISDEDSRKIYSPSITEFILSDKLFGMQSFGNQLLVGLPNYNPGRNDFSTSKINEVYSFDASERSFFNLDFFNEFNDEEILHYFAFIDKIYFVTKSKVYVRIGNDIEELLDRGTVLNLGEQPFNPETDTFCGVFFDEDSLYFIDSDSNTFNKLDVVSHDKTELFKMDSLLEDMNISIYQLDSLFFVVGNFVVFSYADIDCTRFYMYDISEQKIQKINFESTDSYTVINKYNSSIVCGSESDGLFIIDLQSNKKNKICDASVSNIYVVDKKYIYFSDSHKNLYRVDPMTNNIQCIFK